MNREYHKSYSQKLQRDMEMLVFGHAGTPLLVFPTSMGRFYQYEDFGMIRTLADRIEGGLLQVFCVDSVDSESWYNRGIQPRDRVRRHMQYEEYLIAEALPFLGAKNSSRELVATGCSFGGYHTMNFALRHPELVTAAVSMGGAFDIHQFLDGYYDDDCYFNCPPDFLANLSDDHKLNAIRRVRIVLATGEYDICLQDNRQLAGIMGRKGIPNYLDVWGDGAVHDWPWWQRMAVKFF